MKRFTFTVVVFLLFTGLLLAQDENSEKVKDKPVRYSFESGILIDNQTCVIPDKGTLEMLIQHRFGKMSNGIKDVWGIYAPGANIRIGFNYSITNRLMVGYGLTKKNMYNDFQIKYALLQQTRKNTIPVAVTVYGNMAIDGRNESVFKSNYTFANRFSYFSQLIIGRKFCDWFSLQATGSFTHYNKVAEGDDHDKIGVGFNGRVKFSPQSSFQFQYDIPLKIKGISEQPEFVDPSLPNFAVGYELSTSTHAFQIYISTADGIIPQDMYMYNKNDWTKGTSNLMFGFTITRLWGF
ncbi:MAG: DUF5777 family beta-barrel protein [Bacteroidales bacterium]|nr:DUF5777 family beta-barrel protein [Bacteroidales bacterium]